MKEKRGWTLRRRGGSLVEQETKHRGANTEKEPYLI